MHSDLFSYCLVLVTSLGVTDFNALVYLLNLGTFIMLFNTRTFILISYYWYKSNLMVL